MERIMIKTTVQSWSKIISYWHRNNKIAIMKFDMLKITLINNQRFHNVYFSNIIFWLLYQVASISFPSSSIYTPHPSSSLFRHFPFYYSPVVHVNIPSPCFISLIKFPLNIYWLGFVNTPKPCFFPCWNSPL